MTIGTITEQEIRERMYRLYCSMTSERLLAIVRKYPCFNNGNELLSRDFANMLINSGVITYGDLDLDPVDDYGLNT